MYARNLCKIYADQLAGETPFLDDKWMEQIIIDGSNYTYYFYNAAGDYTITGEYTIVSYTPKEGKFTLLSSRRSNQHRDKYVLNNGNSVKQSKFGKIRIVDTSDSTSGFIKHEFISYERFLDPYDSGMSKADKYETMYSALSFSELELTKNSLYSVLTG